MNGDGKPELVAEFDADGTKTNEEQDQNGDGRPDASIAYQNGKRARTEEDTDGDGRIDTVTEYSGDVVRAQARRHGRQRHLRHRVDLREGRRAAPGARR